MIFAQTPVDLASNWNQGVAVGVLTFVGALVAWWTHRAYGANGWATRQSEIASASLKEQTKLMAQQVTIITRMQDSDVKQRDIDAIHIEASVGVEQNAANLVQAAMVACNVLDKALPDSKDEIEHVRRRLRGE